MHTYYKKIIYTVMIVSQACLVACSSSQIAEPVETKPMVQAESRDYEAEKDALEKTEIISPGFKLKISHSADESMSGIIRVDFKGKIKLPYKPDIMAAGMRADALAEKISALYKDYFKIKNTVTVEIVAREYLIEIRGLVEKPGIYTVKLNATIEEVIAVAGGLLGGGLEGRASGSAAKPEYIRIVTPSFLAKEAFSADAPSIHWIRLTDYFSRYDIRNEVLWRGGEELFFQVTGDPDVARLTKSKTIQILGEVHNPGEYQIIPSGDLLHYLGQAGGPTSTADLEEVTVMRRTSGVSTIVDLRQSAISVPIVPGDLILVKSTQMKPGFWERAGSTLISLGGLLVSVVTLIVAF